MSAFEQAGEGQGQVIGLVGEAGVGKSRLCHEFAQRFQGEGLPVYEAAAQAHTKAVPLLPVFQLMRTYFDISEQDSGQTARERIAGKLLLLDESFSSDLPLLFDFLSVSDPDRPSPRMDPEARQRQLLALTKRLIHAQSAREPGITIFEDLHWIDAGERDLPRQSHRGDTGISKPDHRQLPTAIQRALDVEVLLPSDRPRATWAGGDRPAARRPARIRSLA